MTAEANEGFERYEEALEHVRTIGERKEQVKIKIIFRKFYSFKIPFFCRETIF